MSDFQCKSWKDHIDIVLKGALSTVDSYLVTLDSAIDDRSIDDRSIGNSATIVTCDDNATYTATDLRIITAEEVIKQSIDKLWKEWKQLDSEYIGCIDINTRDLSLMSASHLSIPIGFFESFKSGKPLSNDLISSMSHPRISSDKKVEYLHKLYKLFESVPVKSKLCSDVDCATSSACAFESTRLKAMHDKANSGDELCVHKYDDEGLDTNITTAATSVVDYTNDGKVVVMTFAMYTADGSNREEVVDMIGSQTLVVLRDSLYCMHDALLHIDDTANCTHANARFFFVDGIFYIDQHEPDCTVEIRSWLQSLLEEVNCATNTTATNTTARGARKRSKRSNGRSSCINAANVDDATDNTNHRRLEVLRLLSKFGISSTSTLQVRCMNDVSCEELRLTPGKAYLYSHHGNCEHLVYLHDVRLHCLATDVTEFMANYPKKRYMPSYRRRNCSACELWLSSYVVYGDRLAATSPVYYCEHCYYMIHYDNDNNLLYDDFRVFPYLHDDNANR